MKIYKLFKFIRSIKRKYYPKVYYRFNVIYCYKDTKRIMHHKGHWATMDSYMRNIIKAIWTSPTDALYCIDFWFDKLELYC